MSDSKPKNEEDKISLDVAKEIIELQKEDLELRKGELSLREKEIDNSHEYSLKALNANKTIYENFPNERRKDRWQKIGAGVIGFILFSLFFIYLFEIGQNELASELIKTLVALLFGGGAGYGIGFHKGRKYQKKQDEEG